MRVICCRHDLHTALLTCALRSMSVACFLRHLHDTTRVLRSVAGYSSFACAVLLKPYTLSAQGHTSDWRTVFTDACATGNTTVITAIMAVPGLLADAHRSRMSPVLHVVVGAIRSRNLEPLRLFLRHPRVDVNKETVSGVTAFHRSLAAEDTGIIALLLHTPGINLCSSVLARTTTHTAAQHGHTEALRRVLMAGGDRFASNAGTLPTSYPGPCGAVFAAMPDYWRRRDHGHYHANLRAVVRTLLLVCSRGDVPAEMFLHILSFVRSCDFL